MYIFQSPKQPNNQATNQPPSQPTPNLIQWYPEFPNQQLCTVILNNKHILFAATNVFVHPTETAATRRKKHGDSSDRTKSLDIIWLFNIAMTNDP